MNQICDILNCNSGGLLQNGVYECVYMKYTACIQLFLHRQTNIVQHCRKEEIRLLAEA